MGTFCTRKSTCSEAREGDEGRKKDDREEERGYTAATAKRIGEDRTRWAAHEDEERDIGEERREQNGWTRAREAWANLFALFGGGHCRHRRRLRRRCCRSRRCRRRGSYRFGVVVWILMLVSRGIIRGEIVKFSAPGVAAFAPPRMPNLGNARRPTCQTRVSLSGGGSVARLTDVLPQPA